MKAQLHLDSFLGNQRVVEILLRAIQQERLPHALIFAGPPGVGKRTLAELLAEHLNCLHPENNRACTSCASCRKIRAGTHPDVRLIQPEGAFIKIEQIRILIGEIAYQPFEAKFRVVILDGADQMRSEASNCLLKTLEEPPSRTVFVLIAPKPYRLLQTVRSRSRLLQFGSIPDTAIEEFLVGSEDWTREDARLAAVFSDGSIGAAKSFDVASSRRIRDQALQFVTLLLQRQPFFQASALAATVSKDKELFPVWVDMTSALLQEVYFAQMAPGKLRQRDIEEPLSTLAASSPHKAVVSALRAIRGLRNSLLQNVNRQLALEALFLAETGRFE
jgi:DNA polymerase-3 subunit delta'